MKKLFSLILLLAGFGTASAQVDTIFTHESPIPCKITEITETGVKFCYPGEDLTNTISKNSITSIVYKSGRIQQFSNRTAFRILKSPLEWQQVSLTQVEGEVASLFKIDDVSSKAKGTTELSNQERVKRRALDKLKMQAAMLGGNVIYMLNMRTEGNKINSWTGMSSSAEASFMGAVYSSKVPNFNQVQNLLGDQSIFSVVEELSYTNNSTKINSNDTNTTFTLHRVYDDNGNVMVEGEIPGCKETTFRVTFCNQDSIYILYSTRRGTYTYKVMAQ